MLLIAISKDWELKQIDVEALQIIDAVSIEEAFKNSLKNREDDEEDFSDSVSEDT